jgi:methyl-accepting chemotaxis protein
VPPAYKQLAADFHNMRHQISNLVIQMTDAAHGVKSGAHEISCAANDLANRTEQQAASVAHISEVMREVTVNITTTAGNARDVDGSVAEVSGHASKGGRIMDLTVIAMEKIKNSATEIAQIVDVIDSIAFQTNLLALNAGVEAARAGDRQSFAVVASEVRALAHRTTRSAKNIKTLIVTSNEDVQHGAELVEQMRDALNQIIGRLDDTSSKAGDIASFSEQQSESMKALNAQLQQIDLNTQQNAAMVEDRTPPRADCRIRPPAWPLSWASSPLNAQPYPRRQQRGLGRYAQRAYASRRKGGVSLYTRPAQGIQAMIE